MKKTLLLLSLVSGLAMAATTGSFEVISNAGNTVYKDYDIAKTDFDIEAKGEVKVTGTGFSFGGNIKYDIKAGALAGGDDVAKVWAKYEFPRFYGVGTSLKAVVDYNLRTEVEGNINGSVAMTDLYATVTYKGKKLVEEPAVDAELGATYKGIKDVELGAKAFGGYAKGNKWSAGSELNAKYTGVKDVELAAMVKGKYESNADKKIIIESKPSVSYTGLKNTTISASVENKVELKHDTIAQTVKFEDYTAKPEISASYKYAVTEDLTLMPKIKVGTELNYKKLMTAGSEEAKVYATPELGLTYKPISGLTLSAKAELPIELKAKKAFNVENDLEIKAKGKVAVKYEW